VWRFTPVIPAPKRLRQEQYKFEISLASIVRLSQKPKNDFFFPECPSECLFFFCARNKLFYILLRLPLEPKARSLLFWELSLLPLIKMCSPSRMSFSCLLSSYFYSLPTLPIFADPKSRHRTISLLLL
jgi:hypothetical protein